MRRADPPGADAAETVRLLVADRRELSRRGLALLLGAAEGIEVVGEAGDTLQVLGLSDALAPEVVLVDQDLPPDGGLRACERLHLVRPAVHLILLTSPANVAGAAILRAVGAAGSLARDTPVEEIAREVRLLARAGCR